MKDKQYEIYREKFKIVEWKDDCVYKTESLGEGWFLESEIKSNIPHETNVIYAVCNIDGPGIRVVNRTAK